MDEALVPTATTAVDDDRLRIRHLPLADPDDVERAGGFVRIAKLIAGVPLGAFGAIVFACGLVFGIPYLSIGAAVLTVMILHAIWTDTRLHRALELVRMGELDQARARLTEVAGSRRQSGATRQRARGHLAALAFAAGDISEALRWTRERVAHRTGGREDPRDRWFSDASEVLLLAMLGDGPGSRAALDRLGPRPRGRPAHLVDLQVRLATGFANADPDLAPSDLAGEEAFALEHDGVGVVLSLLCWTEHARGRGEAAHRLAEVVRERSDLEHLRARYPVLAKFVAGVGRGLSYASRH